MNENLITQERLKELLHYNPDTGVFTWIVSRGRCSAGSPAGRVDQDGYIEIQIDKKHYRAHRLAFLYVKGEFPSEVVDHENGLRDDNRFSNLREVSIKENSKNIGMLKSNKTGMSGVIWHKRDRRWQSSIRHNGKKLHLGLFVDFFEACCARKSAERRFGFHQNHGSYR